MLFKKSILHTLFIASASMLPLCAFAGDVTTINNTNRDSTVIVNNGQCSSKILGPKEGVTRKHSTNVIGGTKVKLACGLHQSNCTSDVYMTDNCSGPKIATVVLDTSSGIKSVTMIDTSYSITGNGFTVQIDGGPSPLQG